MEAAALLGLSTTGFRSYVQRGLMPPPRRVGRRTRWLLSEVVEALRRLPVEDPAVVVLVASLAFTGAELQEAIPVAAGAREAGGFQAQDGSRTPEADLGNEELEPVPLQKDGRSGAMVMNVDPRGPGATAGIHQGDIVISWNGEPIRRVQSILHALGPDSVGQTVTIGLRRAGQTQQVSLTIAERPAA